MAPSRYTAIKVWPHYQVLLVMTRGRSHMDRNVTKFSLPSITGNPYPNLAQLPSITGRISTILFNNPHKNLVIEPVLTYQLPSFKRGFSFTTGKFTKFL